MIPVWTVDFESMPIGPRPEHYPPRPTGVSIRPPEGPAYYMSWGHPTGNDCTLEDGIRALCEVWDSGLPIVFHNAKFDLAICYDLLGLPKLPWERVHDTMFLAFLLDPYARTLGLKQLATVWLGMRPDERDEVDEWVLAHKDTLPLFEFIKTSKGEPFGKPTKKNAGAWIGFVPAEIVGPYANGDTERTWRLFQTIYPLVQQAGMQEAYDVERQVLPIFMENERVGLRVDTPRLESDIETYRTAFAYVEDWLRWRLNAQGLNFDADQDVADVLESTGQVTEWAQTKTGKRSVSKKTLFPEMFADPQVASALGYRNRLKTCLSMFMEPWLEQARARNGWISCDWNQVASPEGGTRTGRPSTRNPNFLNISKDFEGKPDGYEHPAFLDDLPSLPLVRCYILPDEGHVILKRDFSGQELRVFAHFEQGDLLRQYEADPNIDVHHYVGANIARMTGQTHWTEKPSRTALKAMNFQGIYGGGVPALADALRITHAEARKFKDFHNQALPGRKILADTLTTLLRQGYAIRTYGGRLYERPPMAMIDGRMRDFDYRMINYLVQGSAADITKRAMIRLNNHPDYTSRFMLQVYDEIDISAPADDIARQSLAMRDAMEDIPLRAKLLTDAEWGHNWGEMQELEV